LSQAALAGDLVAGSEDDRRAAQTLAALATTYVRWVSRDRLRRTAIRATRGRLGRRSNWPDAPALDAGWQDNTASRGMGWRERAAYFNGQPAFEVDYQICRRCRVGWVEEPWTKDRYRRSGLAAAGLAALRTEHPGFSWYTAGDHLSDSEPFWLAVAPGVPGGYQRREICAHRSP
jgi:hypothetical protein